MRGLMFLLLTTLQVEPLHLQIQKMVQTGDSYNAVEVMARQGDPKTVARLYTEVTRDLYRKLRDLPSFIIVSRQGIDYLLAKAVEMERTDVALSNELRGAAKVLSYNLASYTWPGWNEPGIRPTASEIEIGLEAARLNMRLAVELKRGADPLFNAHWIIGALELARGRHAEAIRSYEQARKISNEAALGAHSLLAEGSIAIAKIAGKIDVAAGEREFRQVKSELLSGKVTDGKFYSDQLDTAYKVFTER